jgi:hypothetical protein
MQIKQPDGTRHQGCGLSDDIDGPAGYIRGPHDIPQLDGILGAKGLDDQDGGEN